MKKEVKTKIRTTFIRSKVYCNTWTKRELLFSVSLQQSHNGLRVPWKHCLNLCSWRWLKPSRNLVRSLIPYGLWISKILIIFWKCWGWAANVQVKFVPLRYSWRKKVILKVIASYINCRYIAMPGVVNSIKLGIKSNKDEVF